LLAGNERFATGSPAHVHADFERVAEVRTGQSPFVVIVSCSDSRVPPEIIFDRGIGDLFVVRTAGHVVTTTAAASVMYAIEHLGVTLVVVLGHSGCGAVEAALSDRHTGTYLEPVVRAIRPAVELSASEPGSHWDNAVRAHLRRTVAGLEEAAERRLPSGRGTACRFVGACYDLGTGRVEVVVDAGAPTRTGERDHVEHVGAVPAPPASGHEAVAAVPPEPPPEAATMVLEPGRQEELAAPDAQLTPPGDPSSSRYPHWCPKCRAGFEACTTFCNRCGLLLVQPWFKVPCLKCGKDNLIGEERCWGCRAEVHPAWLASGLRKPRPPLVDFGRPTGANQQTGCGTSVIGAVLLASALCTWALHMALS
jgi:carbonic anhydrase